MDPRQARIEIFEGTRQLCQSDKKLVSAIESSKQNQKIYWEENEIEPAKRRFSKPVNIIVSRRKTVEAAAVYARRYESTCILNFASSVSPGGGVVNGAQAQEESICRVSTLYFALSDPETAGKFYDRHWELIREGKMNRRNTDDIIYTPDVVVVRDDADNERLMSKAHWFNTNVITCAAPDVRQLGDESQYTPDEDELMKVLEKRWSRILAVAANHGAKILILGAFGCGVFANPPRLVAESFMNVIDEYKYHFDTIEFAVYTTAKDSENYNAFLNVIR